MHGATLTFYECFLIAFTKEIIKHIAFGAKKGGVMQHLNKSNRSIRQAYIIPALTVLLFLTLVGISVVGIYFGSKQQSSQIISGDIQQLVTIFKRIHSDCKIIDFDYQKNRINFLNVISFMGSEVGPMNLSHPENWQGPYLEDNPTIQEKEYIIVDTNKGYFITPDDGVVLPNGKTIGKDIILDKESDIAKMIEDGVFDYKGNVLAAPLIF